MDAVEIVIGFEETFDVSIPDSAVEHWFTPHDCIEGLVKLLGAETAFAPCPTQRCYHRIRSALGDMGLLKQNRLSLSETPQQFLGSLLSRDFWERLSVFSALPEIQSCRQRKQGTWRDVVEDATIRDFASLRRRSEPWTRHWIRYGVLGSVSDFFGRIVSDHDRFIEDLGMD
ncbi:MAG: acyl carrier protein [Verrucomicrobiota bacterium]